jgi:hypothetical protein
MTSINSVKVAKQMQERNELPTIPNEWNTIINPQTACRSAMTYSYFHYDQVISAFIISVRRGLWPESAQWALEACRAGPKCKIDFFRQLFLLCSKDIGPANPSLIVLIDKLIDADSPVLDTITEIDVLNCVELVTKSPKDRTIDFLKHLYSQRYKITNPPKVPRDEIYQRVLFLMHGIRSGMEERSLEVMISPCCDIYAMQKAYPDFVFSEHEFRNLRVEFHAPTITSTQYRYLWTIVWLPILGYIIDRAKSEENDIPNELLQKVLNLVCTLYNIACRRSYKVSFRSKPENLIFVIHALHAYVHYRTIEDTWWHDNRCHLVGELSDEDTLRGIAGRLLTREGLLGMPSYALDNTTRAGRKLRRGLEHKILESCKISDVREDGRDTQIRHFKELIEQEIHLGLVDKNFPSKVNFRHLFESNI